MSTIDKLLGELVAVLPRDFTRERNALVARLMKAGQLKEAARLKSVPRPTVPVWAVNRLVREEPKAVATLIATTERMGAAQLGRGGRGRDVQSVGAEHRAALAHLTARAEADLTKAGLGASHQALLRIGTTLTAAAADPAQREALRRGRVERELAARGFDVFAGQRLPPARVVSTAHPREVRAAQHARIEKSEQERADVARKQRQTWLAEATNAIRRAEADLNVLRSQRGAAQQHVQEARRLLHEAQAAETQARAEEQRAAAALRAARAELRAPEGARGRPPAKRRA